MIRFLCVKCGHRLKTKEIYAGRVVGCTRCDALMRVPLPEESPQAPKPEKVEERGPAGFECGNCGAPVALSNRIGGRWARCESCGKIVDIPESFFAAEEAPEGAARAAADSEGFSSDIVEAVGEVADQAAREAPEARSRPKTGKLDIGPFLPPHHAELGKLPDYGIKELRKKKGKEKMTRPPDVLKSGLQFGISEQRRTLYVFVSILLILYAVAEVSGGAMRIHAYRQLKADGGAPAWGVSLPPVASAQSGPTVTAAWLLSSGIALLLLGLAAAFAAGVLLKMRPVAAKLVLALAVLCIGAELVDMFAVGSGVLNVFKPFAFFVWTVALVSVFSR